MLAGCGVHPGAAAVVGSDEISTSEVDDVAVAVCSANLASARVAVDCPVATGFGQAICIASNRMELASEIGGICIPDVRGSDVPAAGLMEGVIPL